MERAYRQLRDRGVMFVGIIVQNREADARRFLAETGISFPTAFDTDLSIARAFHLTAMPLTVLLTRDGQIADRITGPITEEDFITTVRRLL